MISIQELAKAIQDVNLSEARRSLIRLKQLADAILLEDSIKAVEDPIAVVDKIEEKVVMNKVIKKPVKHQARG